jgi:hypothetical protein
MTIVALRDFEGSRAPSATGAPRGPTARRTQSELYLDYDPSMRWLSALLASSLASSENPAGAVSGTARAIVSVTNQRAGLPIIDARQFIWGGTVTAQSKSLADETVTIWTFDEGQSYLSNGVVGSYSGQLLSVVDTGTEEKLTKLHQLPTQTDRINDLLDQYAALKDGWLDGQSRAPGKSAVERARKLYQSARDNGYPPVRCYVSTDGEVGLVWEKDKGYGNVGFWEDGSLVYYVRSADGYKEVRNDIAMDEEELPAELIKVLRTF